MPMTVHMEGEVDPCQVPCAFVNLSSEDIVLEKHMVTAFQDPSNDSSMEKKCLTHWLTCKMRADYHALQKI